MAHDLLAIFDELNATYFGGELPRPSNIVANPLGGQFGGYAPMVKIIFLHPRTLDQEREFVADTMLHEMVHMALEVRTGDHSQDHGSAFVALANQIGERLGLHAIAIGDERVLTWPQSLRAVDVWR